MPISIPNRAGRPWEIPPQSFASGATTLAAYDVVLQEMHLNNPTAANITVSVSDGQGSPIYLIPSQVLPPGGMISMDSALGRVMPSGIIITTSAPGLHGWLSGWR